MARCASEIVAVLAEPISIRWILRVRPRVARTAMKLVARGMNRRAQGQRC
jgi:hypothetical protein